MKIIIKTGLALGALSVATILTGCSDWPGPGSDLQPIPQEGGYDGAGGKFGSWVNNAWGEDSILLPPVKDHPPLQGARACVIEYPDMPCAVTSADGRFDISGIPLDQPVHVSVQLPGYYSLLVPYDPQQGDFDQQPAVEIPSQGLRDFMYFQLGIVEDTSQGGISFMLIDSPELLADPAAEDHHEINALLPGVAIRYRRVELDGQGQEVFGDWSNPASWKLSEQQVVYLDAFESPSANLMMTSSSGLGLALNLEPGLYEVEADDTNFDSGFATADSDYHWNCLPINKTPVGSEPHLARTLVVEGHLADIRMWCEPE